MAETKLAKRVFNYGSLDLVDPDVNMSVDDVKSFYSSVYPELTQSVVEGPEYDNSGNVVYEFKKTVGTKG